MRLEGRLHRWNDERGFGFIRPAGTGRDLFVHISAFAHDGVRPTVGETLFYELGQGRNGQPAAVRVSRSRVFPTAWVRPRSPPPRAAAPRRPREPRRHRVLAPMLFIVMFAAGVHWYGPDWMRGLSPAEPAGPVIDRQFLAESRTPRDADVAAATGLRCDGRTYCSEMRSCSEATWFLQHCPGVRMDGDRDGVPCEEQWCTN